MRELIPKMQLSVDGFVNDPNGDLDWVLHLDGCTIDRVAR